MIACTALATALAVTPPRLGQGRASDDARELAGRFGASFDALLGYARTPYPLDLQAHSRGYTGSFLWTVHGEVHRGLRLAARVPMASAYLIGPGRAAFHTTIAGNPELVGDYERRATTRLRWRVRLGIAIPLGHGDVAPERDRIRGQVQALANALEGGLDPQLHAPGRLGLRPGASVRWDRGRFALSAALDVPLLVRVRGDAVSRSRVNPVGIVPIVGGRVAYRIWRPIFVGLRAWTSVHASWSARGRGEAPPRTEIVLEPEVAFRFAADHVLARIGFRVPLAGPFAGSYALALHLGAAF